MPSANLMFSFASLGRVAKAAAKLARGSKSVVSGGRKIVRSLLATLLGSGSGICFKGGSGGNISEEGLKEGGVLEEGVFPLVVIASTTVISVEALEAFSAALFDVSSASFVTFSATVLVAISAPILLSVKRNPDSFIKKHQLEKHSDLPAEFSAKVTGSFRDCLTRQISEGVHIRSCDGTVLNSKSEWHQPPLWKVQSEVIRD